MFVIVGVLVLLAGGIFVIAYEWVDADATPSIMGHTSREVDVKYKDTLDDVKEIYDLQYTLNQLVARMEAEEAEVAGGINDVCVTLYGGDEVTRWEKDCTNEAASESGADHLTYVGKVKVTAS